MRVIALLLCWAAQVASGARILALLPHFGLTHWMSFRPLVEELAKRGNEVTVVSPFPRSEPLQNYREVSLARMYPKTAEYVNLTDMESGSRFSLSEMYPLLQMARMTEASFEAEEVLALAKEKFDLVIVELFNTEIYHALAYKIKAPVIAICSHQITGWGTLVPSTPDAPSHVAHSLAFRSPPFTFLERLANVVELIIVKTVYLHIYIPGAQRTAEKHLGPLPDLSSLCQNTSLILLNSHLSVTGPRPHNPNVIEVGGINVVPAKPLPADLQQLLDQSKDGVIYFSMGTVLKASTLTEQKRLAFVSALRSLKQTVLWKWDGEMKDKPPNVHIAQWFPQRDIFAHKNIVLFISHCGNLGVHEATHEGIPIICIPLFGDQPYNSKTVESQGMGAILDFYTDIHSSKIKSTINRVLSDPSYRKQARRVSKAYRDRPMTPLQTAVYWVEYVLRHEGAYHLRSTARNMPWYQYHNYDVMLFLHALLFILLHMIYKTIMGIMKLFAMCFKTKPTTTPKSKEKKS